MYCTVTAHLKNLMIKKKRKLDYFKLMNVIHVYTFACISWLIKVNY